MLRALSIFIVLRVSSDSKRLVIFASPRAIDDKISDLCDIDLSPDICKEPYSLYFVSFFNFIS